MQFHAVPETGRRRGRAQARSQCARNILQQRIQQLALLPVMVQLRLQTWFLLIVRAFQPRQVQSKQLHAFSAGKRNLMHCSRSRLLHTGHTGS